MDTFEILKSKLLVLGASLVCTLARSGEGAVFVQDAGSDGLLVVEAEHFSTNTMRGIHAWTLATNAMASGGGGMHALPDAGTNYDSGYSPVSPRLDFNLKSIRTGRHYVWIRSFATGGTNDSVHVGLDGVETPTSDRMGSAVYNSWIWSDLRTNGSRAFIDITNAGFHTLSVWMREDGMVLDKLLLTVNAAYIPSGIGPPESPIEGGSDPGTTNESGRVIPSRVEFAAASSFLGIEDIPQDTFLPPTNAVFVAASGGSDSNPGTLSAPFATLDRATDFVNDRPGTPYTIYLRSGIHYFKRVDPEIVIRRSNIYVTRYSNEPVTIRPFYWPNRPTNYWDLRCLRALGPYTNITFDGMVIEGWQIAVSVSSESGTGVPMRHVTVKNIIGRNFTTRGGNRAFFEVPVVFSDVYGGIIPDPTTAHFQLEDVILSNVESSGTEVGIDVGDENDGTIKRIRISNYRFLNAPSAVGETSEKDAIALVNCYKALIDSCTISNAAHDGIDLKSYDVLIANTLVQRAGRNGVKFWRNGELVNSIVYNCGPTLDDGALIVKQGPFRLINSALITKPIGYSATFGYGETPANAGSLEIANCIFFDLENSFYVVNNSLTSRNSLYFNVRDYLFTGGVGNVANVSALNARVGSSNNIALDPRLTDVAQGNLIPRFDSPCINAGTTNVLLPSFDYFGRPRVSAGRVDIGPFEYAVQRPAINIALQSEGRQLVFRWVSESGASYNVESATSILGSWNTVSGMSGLVGTGGTLSVTNSVPNQSPTFYRLVVQ